VCERFQPSAPKKPKARECRTTIERFACAWEGTLRVIKIRPSTMTAEKPNNRNNSLEGFRIKTNDRDDSAYEISAVE